MAYKACPRKGSRVRFVPNPAARMFYDSDTPPAGATGVVTTVPTGRGRSACMPGPRGGMVYVDWDGRHTEGVFRADLEPEKKGRR